MKQADREGRLYRERQFVMGLPACQVLPNCKTEDEILVQGMIDAYIEEEAEIWLIDYKTDRIRQPGDFVRKYQRQMELYARALTGALGKPVTKRILYSFHLHSAIELDGMDAAGAPSGDGGTS